MEGGRSKFVLTLVVIISISINGVKNLETKTITVRMPDIKPLLEDSHICRALRVDPTVEYYIKSYEPLADKETAHHMMVLGCEAPGSTEETWNCRNMDNGNELEYFPSCKRGLHEEIIYVWANNAGKFEMPKDVGFMVGGSSKIYYIVVQVHYVSVERFAAGVTDNSGIKITYTNIPTPKLASIFHISSLGRILPNSTEYFEIACRMTNDVPIYPFAFRVHTHALGRVVSGYKAVKGKDVPSEKWTLIGKKDPRLPQAFYPVTNEVEIRNGDYLMTRCTYVNDRSVTVRTGSRAEDEMCVFYIVFWTASKDFTLPKCASPGPPYVDWHRYNFMLIPEDASTLSTTDNIQMNETYHFGIMN